MIGRRFYLCNPAARRCAPVRQLLEHKLGRPCLSTHVVGFYQHQPSGEYRVLYWLRPKSDDGGGAPVYYVLTVESGVEPRYIGSPAAAALPSAALRLPYSFDDPPVFYRGSMHWELHGPNDDTLMVFDVVAETFRRMRRPAHLIFWTSLLEINDSDGMVGLCISGSRDNRVIELWVPEDYGAELWSLKHRINLETLSPSPPVDRFTLFNSLAGAEVAVLNECEVLISIVGRVLQCDVHGNFFGLLECGGRLCSIARNSIRESILPHPFFEMQEEIAVNNNMPFLLGV